MPRPPSQKATDGMSVWIIWGAALLAYAVFRLWYDSWSGPLKSAEIEAFLSQMAGRFEGTGNSPDVLRAFLEADDGREFVMLNLVKAQLDLVEDPQTGQMVQGFELLKRYSLLFLLFLRHLFFGLRPVLLICRLHLLSYRFSAVPRKGKVICFKSFCYIQYAFHHVTTVIGYLNPIFD
mgnify:CR=1 FL=1